MWCSHSCYTQSTVLNYVSLQFTLQLSCSPRLDMMHGWRELASRSHNHDTIRPHFLFSKKKEKRMEMIGYSSFSCLGWASCPGKRDRQRCSTESDQSPVPTFEPWQWFTGTEDYLIANWYILPPSKKEYDYRIRASQSSSSLIKFITNSINFYVFK